MLSFVCTHPLTTAHSLLAHPISSINVLYRYWFQAELTSIAAAASTTNTH
jgi:hypothetical protein